MNFFQSSNSRIISISKKRSFRVRGLWESWIDRTTGEELETCTIITTEANKVLEPVHERIPVIFKPESYDDWLDEKEKNIEKLQKLLAPYPAQEMDSHAVSKSVNVPDVDSAELIKPLNSLLNNEMDEVNWGVLRLSLMAKNLKLLNFFAIYCSAANLINLSEFSAILIKLV